MKNCPCQNESVSSSKEVFFFFYSSLLPRNALFASTRHVIWNLEVAFLRAVVALELHFLEFHIALATSAVGVGIWWFHYDGLHGRTSSAAECEGHSLGLTVICGAEVLDNLRQLTGLGWGRRSLSWWSWSCSLRWASVFITRLSFIGWAFTWSSTINSRKCRSRNIHEYLNFHVEGKK